MPLGHFDALPEGEGSNEFPKRRGKYIDVEVFGELFATSGTFDSVTISNATITSATITGSVTVGSITINGATGQITLGSNAVLDDSGYIAFGSTPPTSYGNNIGIWIGDDSGTGKASFYSDATNFLQWNGSSLALSGAITATSGSFTGSITVGDDLISDDWDGTTPLSLPDAGATTGFALDGASGDAQFQSIYAEGGDLGTLGVTGTLEMGTGGAILTGPDTGQHIAITNADKNIIAFYSGDASEKLRGTITQATNGAGSTRTIQFGTYTPQITLAGDPTDTDAIGSLVVRSGSPDGSSFNPGFVFAQGTAPAGAGRTLEIRIQNSIPLISDGEITATGDITSTAGTVYGGNNVIAYNGSGSTGYPIMRTDANDLNAVSFSFTGDANTGFMRSGADILEIVAGGTKYMTFDDSNNAVYVQNGGLGVGFATGTTLTNGYIYNVPPTSASAANTLWINATGGIYYLARSTSSARYKTNIRSWTPPAIDPLRPVAFTNSEGEPGHGLIAEEVHEWFPDAVVLDDEGRPDGIDWNVLLVSMLYEIQELKKLRIGDCRCNHGV